MLNHTTILFEEFKKIFYKEYRTDPHFEFLDILSMSIRAKSELIELITTRNDIRQSLAVCKHLRSQISTLHGKFFDLMSSSEWREFGGVNDAMLVFEDFMGWVDEIEYSYDEDEDDEDENLTEEESSEALNLIPEVELTKQKEQIRLLYELGVIEFLINRYPNSLKNSKNQTAQLIARILKVGGTSVQPTLNALLNDDASSDKYPKRSTSVDLIIKALNAAESI